MKRNYLWLVGLALLGVVLLAILLIFNPTDEQPAPVQLPVGGTPVVVGDDSCVSLVPTAGGTLIEGVLGQPRFFNPLFSDAYPVDRQLVDLVFDGLTRIDENGRITPGLAQDWTISEDGLAIVFRLRQGITWHDGQPVTTADVAFTYGLLQDPAYPGSPAVGALWQSLTINLIDDNTIEFILPQPYSPFLEAVTRGILPAHLLQGVSVLDLVSHPFNQAPVGTGPFQVDAAVNWQQDSRVRLVPFAAAWDGVPPIEALVWQFFPAETALLDAFAAGQIHAIAGVPPTMLPEVAAQPEVALYSDVRPQLTMLLFNVAEAQFASEVSPMRELGVRQPLAAVLDRNLLVDEVLAGQGVVMNGPILPTTWAYAPSLLPLPQLSVADAAARLTEAGWSLPEGTAVRQQGEASLVVTLVGLDTAVNRALAQAIRDQWLAVGVDTAVALTTSMDELRSVLGSRSFDVALVDVAPPQDPDQYDFWSQEAIVRGQNYAGWNNRRASESLESGRQVWPVAERRPYYNTFLRLYNTDQPALTLYQHIYTYAIHTDVEGVDIGRMTTPRLRLQFFNNWHLQYESVPVPCPPAT